MELFDVILKLIEVLGLLESNELKQLRVDVKAYQGTCVEDSEDTFKSYYAKMHKGVLIKLAMPFVYFYLLKQAKELSTGTSDDEVFD